MLKEKFNWILFIKRISVIAIPVALQNLLTTTGTMIDTIMIAPLGETTVGAVGLCGQFASVIFFCYWGFVGGGMLFFSQYWGAGDEDGIDRSFETTMIFLMSVSFIFCFLASCFPLQMMRIFTDKPVIQQIGAGYLRIVAFSYPFQIFATGASALLRSTERVKIPLLASTVSVFSNIILNYVLINGKLGFPKLGERGAAIATTSAAAINAAVIIITVIVKKYPYVFRFFKHPKLSRAWLAEYLKKCFPIICNEFLVGLGFTINNIVLGRQSEEAIAALAVFRTLEGFVIGFFAGFSNASSVLVGKSVGAGKLKVAYENAKRLILLCGCFIALVCIVLFSIHGKLLHVMSLSGESFRICTGFVGVYCIAAVIRMCNWTQNDTFRAAGDSSFGTLLEILFMYAMVIPAVVLSGFVFKLPVIFVFICCYIDEPIRFIIMQIHLYSGKWIKPVTEEGKKALESFSKK